jgi:hypothetical protein
VVAIVSGGSAYTELYERIGAAALKERTPMHILLDITVVATLVVTAWAVISTVTRRYGDVSIWPME